MSDEYIWVMRYQKIKRRNFRGKIYYKWVLVFSSDFIDDDYIFDDE